MQVQPNDFVLVEVKSESDRKQKPVLVRVSKTLKGGGSNASVIGLVEKTLPRKNVTVEFSANDVVLNLGSDPYPGTVHGYNLNYIFRRTKSLPVLGDVHLFCRVTKEQSASLIEGAHQFANLLKKNKLSFLLSTGTELEIVSKEFARKYAGMYMHSKDPEKHPHRVQITLDKSRVEASSIANYAYVLAHEFGHALHFQFLKQSSKADAAWIKAYTDTVKPVQIQKSAIASFLATLKSTGSVSGARGDLGEEEIPLFRRVLKEVQTSAGLSAKEIDLLLAADRAEVVEAAWPKSGLMHHELHPSVTEYALKNYKELFAESFAFWLLGKELPKHLTTLMEKSVSHARVYGASTA